ncbi:MAG: hypothetical protein CMO80_16735 [Verrucomicrobiales bacterium]|nr:hypothetical protein [Verrucomicrobiales bacterium]|tara:strand:- start:7146 stop:7934 length:789 start_codon:yes stop_codon:yes gene_type:complete
MQRPNRPPFVSFLIMILAVLGSATPLFAWGPGHDDVNRIALARLPGEIKALLSPEDRKAFVADSHAPDDFTPWAEYERKKGRAIDPRDLATLADHNLKTPYALHSAKGQAVNFILLHRALKDRDGSRIAFWGACLAHTLADEAACNHDPLIHYLTYAFTSGYGMKFGKAGMLDFGELCRSPEGYALAVNTFAEPDFHTLIDGLLDCDRIVRLAVPESAKLGHLGCIETANLKHQWEHDYHNGATQPIPLQICHPRIPHGAPA